MNISKRFVGNEGFFENLISHFSVKDNPKVDDFNDFLNPYKLDSDSEIYNVLFSLFNDIRNYKNGGKFELFKYHEAEWGVPTNLLTASDINDKGDLEDLSGIIEIYRGMSRGEYESDDFGQSWTTDYETALRFAENTYSEKPKGIVVKSTISKIEVLHYDKNKEFEVIVIKGSHKKSNVSIASW